MPCRLREASGVFRAGFADDLFEYDVVADRLEEKVAHGVIRVNWGSVRVLLALGMVFLIDLIMTISSS